MAADSHTFPKGFIIFALFSVLVSVAFSPASAQTAGNADPCTDGTYKHGGRDCCLCAAGLYLVKHCTSSSHDGECNTCDPGTYSSHPNDQISCDRCTSCSHPNENLEVDESCTPARDTKCRCKKNHYCVSGMETCKLCHLCKECGAEGIKVACAANNNTVCNDIIEGEHHVGLMVGVIIFLLIAGAAAAVLIYWKIQQRRRQQADLNALDVELQSINEWRRQQADVNALDVELQRLKDVDLLPHLPDISQVIEWKDMKSLAIRSSVPTAVIESCRQDHLNDSQERTLQLLMIWVEKQGREAKTKLIQDLNKIGKKGIAEKVIDILSHGS